MIIEDGRGSGTKARVDGNNHLHTHAITQAEILQALDKGDAYNINTGSITFSAAGTLIYIKNNEDQDLLIEAFAIGTGTGTFSDSGEITLIRNPTGGDLISDATAVSINQNRNHGSAKTLSVTVYKGKSGGTITGGNDSALVFQTGSTRSYNTINFLLPKGQSLAIKIDPKLSSGSMKAYAALICYLKDANSKD